MIHLDFIGPSPVIALKNEGFLQASGIYLWAVHTRTNVYRIKYVGETGRSFYTRVKEHVIQTLGGNYRICDADALVEGREVSIWDGMWRPGTRDRVPELIANIEQISSAAKAYLSVLDLFVASMEGSTQLRRRVEKVIVSSLRRSPEASALLPNDIRYQSPQNNEQPITLYIHCPVSIQGLPSIIQCE